MDNAKIIAYGSEALAVDKLADEWRTLSATSENSRHNLIIGTYINYWFLLVKFKTNYF